MEEENKNQVGKVAGESRDRWVGRLLAACFNGVSLVTQTDSLSQD